MRIFAVIRWHCTNEKFSAQKYIDVNCNYPGDWDGAIERIEECEKGNLDIILTKSVSRFGRDTKEFLEAIRKIRSCGTRIIFEKDKIDTETVKDELLISTIEACYQAENDWRSENIRFGLKIQSRGWNIRTI